MTKSHALIVDDEPDIRELLEITLGRMDVLTQSAANVETAKDLLRQQHFDLCLTDLQLPDGNGIDLVQFIQKHQPEMPIAVITAFGSIDTAISALKAGAFDYVSKPVDLNQLREVVQNALKLSLSESIDTHNAAINLLGDSAPMQKLKQQVQKLSRSQAPVYIEGASGTGKEMVARLIHHLGPRKQSPFVPVNCGAIPTELMESEFFGHKKGSFTGAYEDKKGLFQAAQGGTLFLDEVADLPLEMQVKLLRALQEKKIRPVGSQKEVLVDIRVLSATHKSLLKQVQSDCFRQDLYYRLNVIQINVPSLAERSSDIGLLAEHIMGKIAEQWSIPKPKLHSKARQTLEQYTFPGNVRELENILERAITLCDESEILEEHLQLNTTAQHSPMNANTHTDANNWATLPADTSLEDYLINIEKAILLRALEETRWNRTTAAKNLGLSFRSLRYRLKKLGIDDDHKQVS